MDDTQGVNETNEPTQETNQVISEDAVKNHPLYQQLLSESIERRQTIKQLKEQIDSKPVSQESLQTSSDVDPLQMVMNELAQLKQSLQQTTLTAKREAIVAKYAIPEDAQDLLTATDAEQLEVQAQKLSNILRKSPKPAPQDVSDAGVNSDPSNNVSDLQKRVMARLKGTADNFNPMTDAKLAVNAGGGVRIQK